MAKRRRRYRKNPSTMTWLLLLGGGVGIYMWLRKKSEQPAVLPSAPMTASNAVAAEGLSGYVGGCGSLGCGGKGSLQG